VRLIISEIQVDSFLGSPHPINVKARGQVPPTHSIGPDVTTTGNTTAIAITPVIGIFCIVPACPRTLGNDDYLCNLEPCRTKHTLSFNLLLLGPGNKLEDRRVLQQLSFPLGIICSTKVQGTLGPGTFFFVVSHLANTKCLFDRMC
jgi:hypothetical protein